jgi:DNA-binding transcriptional MerR regulator
MAVNHHLLSIGEFSKVCEVSTKTLRYYEEIGLITPDKINPGNGYRYYSIRQLQKMLFINRLKSYHFSLEEIKTILEFEKDSSEEQLCSALHRKRREIQEKLNAFEHTFTYCSIRANAMLIPAGVLLSSTYSSLV